jgi:hypothetical protein
MKDLDGKVAFVTRSGIGPRLYIFPHAELREELRSVEEIRAALPDRPPDPWPHGDGRGRRQRRWDAAAVADALR